MNKVLGVFIIVLASAALFGNIVIHKVLVQNNKEQLLIKQDLVSAESKLISLQTQLEQLKGVDNYLLGQHGTITDDVLNITNTHNNMNNKIKECFSSGCCRDEEKK